MKQRKVYIPLLIVAFFIFTIIFGIVEYQVEKRTHAQVVQPVTPQLAILTQIGPPTASCDAANTPQVDINSDPAQTALGRFYQCNANSGSYGWMPLPAPSWFYLNGVLLSNPKCDIVTGMTAANGTSTKDISGMGFAALAGTPQVIVEGTVGSVFNPVVTAKSVTSISIYITGGPILSVLGLNVLNGNAAAANYSMTVCGT